MTASRDDLEAAVRAAFPNAAPASILAELDRYGTQAHENETLRVQLAIVALSRGSHDTLLHLLQCAKTDYRDVLAWQELGPLPAAEGERLERQARGLIDQGGKS